MPTFYIKTKSELEAKTKELTDNEWWIYLQYQATDGSFVVVAFENKRPYS